MPTQKYTINQYTIDTILAWIKSDEIAIPEIQRPFVWNASKVRDLMDSLYNGYPVGYFISWRNPDVKLKDGTSALGKRVLIDGQQRVAALNAAVLGEYVINKDYRKVKIQIAYHPVDEKFEVFNPAIGKDDAWLPDIAKIISEGLTYLRQVSEFYCKKNDVDQDLIFERLDKVRKITQTQVGLIELAPALDIETVTEIFIRINSEGVVLSQADFVMSKIASNEHYGGTALRKAIDYFCHLAIAPEFYPQLKDLDDEFTQTQYFQQMKWLRKETDDLYDPSYTDLLRVAFASEFQRGRLTDLVSLLSGRNFETRTFEEEIAEDTFRKLGLGIEKFINETQFKRFVMIVKSAGLIKPFMIRSKNVINMAYALYLKLRDLGYEPAEIERYVRKWFVMSILTRRYSGSAESQIDFDIKQVAGPDFPDYYQSIEEGELSDAYWNVALPQNLTTSVASSPFFHVYLASQVNGKDKGFLSREITTQNLITHRGDIHHVFPRDFLKKRGLTKGRYNQIANYVYMQSEINIRIGNKAPKTYFGELKEQCNGGDVKYGGITTMRSLNKNLKMNAIPKSVFEMDFKDYDQFLEERRILMAQKIKEYYFSL